MTRTRALAKAPQTVVATAALVGLTGGTVAVQLDLRDDDAPSEHDDPATEIGNGNQEH